jgi:hypothetical protein
VGLPSFRDRYGFSCAGVRGVARTGELCINLHVVVACVVTFSKEDGFWAIEWCMVVHTVENNHHAVDTFGRMLAK